MPIRMKVDGSGTAVIEPLSGPPAMGWIVTLTPMPRVNVFTLMLEAVRLPLRTFMACAPLMPPDKVSDPVPVMFTSLFSSTGTEMVWLPATSIVDELPLLSKVRL